MYNSRNAQCAVLVGGGNTTVKAWRKNRGLKWARAIMQFSLQPDSTRNLRNLSLCKLKRLKKRETNGVSCLMFMLTTAFTNVQNCLEKACY